MRRPRTAGLAPATRKTEKRVNGIRPARICSRTRERILLAASTNNAPAIQVYKEILSHLSGLAKRTRLTYGPQEREKLGTRGGAVTRKAGIECPEKHWPSQVPHGTTAQQKSRPMVNVG